MKPVTVLIVDDSALIRQMFTQMLGAEPDITVLGTACDPLDAREKIKQLRPDVLTLDIEMPKMDGLSFLEKIMMLRPMPVIMCSSLTQKGADETIRALEIGADYVCKLEEGPPVSNHRPSVDLLFHSVAEAAGPNAVGIILTGMGKDGAQGLKAMRDSGVYTIGQNQASCVVYGMPQAAAKLGATRVELPLHDIAQAALKQCEQPSPRSEC